MGEYTIKLTAKSGKALPETLYVFFTGENCALTGIATETNAKAPAETDPSKPSEEETKPSQSPVVYGDADGNGRVEVSDAIGVLKFVVNLETFTADQENAADVNGDHRADVSDAILILKRIVNLIDHFDVEKSER